jgi:uncharacterized protein YjbI with pentapeptide repeats
MNLTEIKNPLHLHKLWLKCDVNGKRANLTNQDLKYEYELPNSNLSKAILRGIDLNDRDLSGINLSGADLSCANLAHAKLPYSNLSNTNLSDADLRGTDLRGTDLRGANLQNTKVEKENLKNAILNGNYILGFEDALLAIKKNTNMRLKTWSTDTYVSMHNPDCDSFIDAPYLYIVIKNKFMPWLPNHMEILSNEWETFSTN